MHLKHFVFIEFFTSAKLHKYMSLQVGAHLYDNFQKFLEMLKEIAASGFALLAMTV
jgi:hypothetical protein